MDMIIKALETMLFGMAGIFVVMGLIIFFVYVLNAIGKNAPDETGEEHEDSDE